jgi:hypothetical protein
MDTNVSGWQLVGVVPYWGIPFAVTQGISVQMLSRVQCKSTGVYNNSNK